jgi:cytochrome c oxidase assembly protein subunit 15
VASTWPTINAEWIPAALQSKESFLVNAVNNTIWIHFVHRGLAYLLFITIIFWAPLLLKLQGNNFWVRARVMPLVLVFVQLLLGIFTVLSSVHIIPGVWGGFEWMAQLHQLVGMLLLLSVVNIMYATKKY